MSEPVDVNADSPEFAARVGAPRVDALTATFYLRCDECPNPIERLKCIHPDDARQLERELSSVTQRLAEVEKEHDKWKLMYDEEYAIVNRIWKQLGVQSYADAGGKTIYDFISALQSGDARKALQELVRLKDLEKRKQSGQVEYHSREWFDWNCNREPAWEAARAALASLDTKEG